MSMQSLLVVSGYGSVQEAFLASCYGGRMNNPAIKRFVAELSEVRVSFHSYQLELWRTLPNLRRGVPSQQYPMFGAAWPYIRSRHWHYRKHKRRSAAPRPLDCDDGIPVWSQVGKRKAKHTNNKRRRAEDKREIAWEMDLWVQDDEYKIVREESWVYSVARGNTNLLAQDYGACNVYVPPHPGCFAGHVTYGNVSIRVAQGLNTSNPSDYDPRTTVQRVP